MINRLFVRDWLVGMLTPPKGAELANITLWQEACKRAAQILLYAQPGGPTELQLRVRQMNKVPTKGLLIYPILKAAD